MHKGVDDDDIECELQVNLQISRGLANTQQPDLDDASGQHGDQRGPRDAGVGLADDVRILDGQEDAEQQAAQRDSEHVEEDEDAPGEVLRAGQRQSSVPTADSRGLKGFDGGHRPEFYPIDSPFLGRRSHWATSPDGVTFPAFPFRGQYRTR